VDDVVVLTEGVGGGAAAVVAVSGGGLVAGGVALAVWGLCVEGLFGGGVGPPVVGLLYGLMMGRVPREPPVLGLTVMPRPPVGTCVGSIGMGSKGFVRVRAPRLQVSADKSTPVCVAALNRTV
jgi:hypothetical protein